MKEPPRVAQLCSSSPRWCTDRPALRGLCHLIAFFSAGPPSLVVFPLGSPMRPSWEDEKARGCCLLCKYRVLVGRSVSTSVCPPPPLFCPIPVLGSQQLSALGRNSFFSPRTSSTLGGGCRGKRTRGVDAGRWGEQTSPAFRVRWHRPQHARTPFLSLQGLLSEPEFAFRIAWNPWINSSSPQILFALNTQQFQGVSESGGEGLPDSFLLETAVGTFRASGSSCASQIGLLVSGESFSSELKDEG